MVLPRMEFNYEELYKEAKGYMRLGNLNVMWDLTDGLTKEQWIKRQTKIFEPDKHYVKKDGRIMIPIMNIF